MFNLEKIGRSTDQLLTETICRRPTTPLKKKERLQCTNFFRIISLQGREELKIKLIQLLKI